MREPLKRSRPNILRAVTATVVAAVAVAPFSFGAASAAAACPPGAVISRGEWTTIRGPAFTSGDRTITAHAVDAADEGQLYATNSAVVAVSRDGGCKWKESTPGSPTSTGVIVRIEPTVPQGAALLIDEQVAGTSRPRVEITRDGGRTWQAGGAGLPPQGEPEFLRRAPSNPTLLYLGVDVGGGSVDLLYASTDGGLSFTLRNDVSKLRPSSGITGLEVDPGNQASLWASSTSGLYHSKDGGATFDPVEQFEGVATGPVDVFGAAGASRIMVFQPGTTELQISRDGGKSWFRADAPLRVDSVAHGSSADDVVSSGAAGVFRFRAAGGFWENLGAPTPGTRALVANRALGVAYFGHSDLTIERYQPLPGGGIPGIDVPRNVSLVVPPKVAVKEARFGPNRKKIVLKAGESKTVRYRLDLPKRPRPLDVFFLVDTSSSMTRVLDGLAESLQDIVNGLAKERIDVQFGLGEYRAFPDAFPPRNPEHNFIYKRVVQVGPCCDALAAAIEDLRADAGGVYDAQLGGLYQMATGAGQDIFPVGVQNDGDVPAGLQANFRDKSIRVVINPTDEKFGQVEGQDRNNFVGSEVGKAPPPDIPSFAEVIGALNERTIEHVGLSIGQAAARDLTTVSRGTTTYAYGGGVDCDGNGKDDLREGDPLVCTLRAQQSDRALNLVPAVVGLLRAVQDPVEVSLDVQHGKGVVSGVQPKVYPSVILQSANRLEFDVRFRCSRAQAGERFDVELGVETRGRRPVRVPDGVAEARVVCRDEPVEDDFVPPPPFVIPLVSIAVPPPPPPPPAEVSGSSQVQAQSQAQAQGAAAHQEQEQPQLAYVTAFEAEEDVEWAMSRYTERRTVPAGAALGMGVVAVSLMYGAGVAARRRVQVAKNRR